VNGDRKTVLDLWKESENLEKQLGKYCKREIKMTIKRTKTKKNKNKWGKGNFGKTAEKILKKKSGSSKAIWGKSVG